MTLKLPCNKSLQATGGGAGCSSVVGDARVIGYSRRCLSSSFSASVLPVRSIDSPSFCERYSKRELLLGFS